MTTKRSRVIRRVALLLVDALEPLFGYILIYILYAPLKKMSPFSGADAANVSYLTRFINTSGLPLAEYQYDQSEPEHDGIALHCI